MSALRQVAEVELRVIEAAEKCHAARHANPVSSNPSRWPICTGCAIDTVRAALTNPPAPSGATPDEVTLLRAVARAAMLTATLGPGAHTNVYQLALWAALTALRDAYSAALPTGPKGKGDDHV